MTTFGQLCLLAAFVASGYAAGACFVGWKCQRPRLQRVGIGAAILGFLLLTAVSLILIAALLIQDNRFAYVAQYASRHLPWYYALSAFWVGQAGSLLLWAWWVGLLAMIYRLWPRALSALWTWVSLLARLAVPIELCENALLDKPAVAPVPSAHSKNRLSPS